MKKNFDEILNEINAELGSKGNKTVIDARTYGKTGESLDGSKMAFGVKSIPLSQISGSKNYDVIKKAALYAKENGFFDKIAKNYNTKTDDIVVNKDNVIFNFDDGGTKVVPVSKILSFQKPQSKADQFRSRFGA